MLEGELVAPHPLVLVLVLDVTSLGEAGGAGGGAGSGDDSGPQPPELSSRLCLPGGGPAYHLVVAHACNNLHHWGYGHVAPGSVSLPVPGGWYAYDSLVECGRLRPLGDDLVLGREERANLRALVYVREDVAGAAGPAGPGGVA